MGEELRDEKKQLVPLPPHNTVPLPYSMDLAHTFWALTHPLCLLLTPSWAFWMFLSNLQCLSGAHGPQSWLSRLALGSCRPWSPWSGSCASCTPSMATVHLCSF